MKIIDFINKKEMSLRLKKTLILASKKYNYMTDLSVIKLYKIRNIGIREINLLIEIYPELENEIGIISVETIKNYKKWI